MLRRISASTLSIVVTLASLLLLPTTYARNLLTVASAAGVAAGNQPTSSQQETQRNAPLQFSNEQQDTSNQQKQPASQALPPIPYPDVNQYIMKHHIQHAPVVKDPRIDTLPQLPYKYGTYIGVVIHEVGEDYRTLQEWVDRMYATYDRAFVHAFVDPNEIHLTAPSQYLVWGAGKQANPYFYQIELVRVYSYEDFVKSVNNQAWLAAYMLKQNGIEPTLADRQEGAGSIISHYAVNKYWGGTTHVDPIAYFARWGYDMDQFFELVQYHYSQMN